PYYLFGLFNPNIFIVILTFKRWWKRRERENAYLLLFFLCIYLSMAFSVFADSLPKEINILVLLNKLFLALGFLFLFLFLVLYFPMLKKYRSFIILHIIFVIFIGMLYLPELTTISVYTEVDMKLPCYNQNLSFSIAFLSYLLFWASLVIYYLYRCSLLTEKLSARVKLHLFIVGVFFTLLGVLCIEPGLMDTRDIYVLEFTGKIYGIVFHIIAFVLFVTSLFVPKSLLKLWEEHVFSPKEPKSLRNVRNLLILILGIGLNVVGGKLTSYFNLPFFADTIGTALVAFTLGPWTAATVGLLTNFLLSFVAGVAYFPFAICNILVGLLWGYFAKFGYARIVGIDPEVFWRKFIKFIIFNGIVVGIINACVSTVVSLSLFGGFSGHGAEFIALETQKYIGSITGNFLARLGIETFDKSCAILVALFTSMIFFQRESTEFLKPSKRKVSVRVDSREVIVFLLLLVILGLGSVPLFFHLLVLPSTAIVTPYSWILINFVWIFIVTILGLVVLYKWTK
ncbi:MAG: hypothetical protein QXQ54_08000, partial [Thermoplasmata archaeon]